MKYLPLLLLLCSCFADDPAKSQLTIKDYEDANTGTVRIWNEGAETKEFYIRVMQDSFIIGEVMIEKIDKKSYIDFTIDLDTSYQLTIILDIFDDVSESNETDNIFQQYINGGAG